MNLETWLAKGHDLKQEHETALDDLRTAEGRAGRLRQKTNHLSQKIGSLYLARPGFQQVLNGTDAAAVIKQCQSQGEQITQEQAALLHETEQLRAAKGELEKALAEVDQLAEVEAAAAESLANHSDRLPADSQQQIKTLADEIKALADEIGQLDAALARIESEPVTQTGDKLSAAEAAYSHALADSELKPDDPKLKAKAEKLRTEYEDARTQASRPSAIKTEKLDALTSRRKKAETRLEELEAMRKEAVTRLLEPKADQSRAAIMAALKKHLAPAIGKHNALAEVLDANAPDGLSYSHMKTSLETLNKFINSLEIDPEELAAAEQSARITEREKLEGSIQ